MLELEQQRQGEMDAMEAQRTSMMLANYGQLFEGLGGMAEAFAGKQSGVARAMFAVSKAFAVADSIVKIQQGIASAAAIPFPANIPAMAAVASSTAGLVSTIKGTNMSGMAHDGIDSIPETGTWLLEKGERVTTAETSAKLDRTLEDIRRNGSGGGGNVHIHNHGNDSVRAERMPGGDWKVLIERVENHLAQGIASGQGKLNRSIEQSLNAPRRVV